jgi:hypothetical protein
MAIDTVTVAIVVGIINTTVILFLLYKPILQSLTPQGVPGIPAYPNPTPILGDLGRVVQAVKKFNCFGPLVDQLAQDLGPIAQLRISFLQT